MALSVYGQKCESEKTRSEELKKKRRKMTEEFQKRGVEDDEVLARWREFWRGGEVYES